MFEFYFEMSLHLVLSLFYQMSTTTTATTTKMVQVRSLYLSAVNFDFVIVYFALRIGFY